MQTSDSIKSIAGALVEFHKAVGKIPKDARNPFFKSKYASLSGILEVISEPLTANGLSIAQFPESENGLTTRLLHISGEWMESTYQMRPVKDTPQDRGSAITYQRRYAIGAILSLNFDDDDDANAASGKTNTAPVSQQATKTVSNDWNNLIEACKTQKELVELYNKFKSDVDVNPKLQQLISDRRHTLNTKAVTPQTN